MQPSWTLSVRNFGPIAEADVTLAPLTVFIGRNNTGKSYLASLIWGLLNPEGLLFPREVPTDEAYLACDAVIGRATEEAKAGGGEARITDFTPFVAWIRHLLITQKQAMLAALFSVPDMDADVIAAGILEDAVHELVLRFPESKAGICLMRNTYGGSHLFKIDDTAHARLRTITRVATALLTGIAHPSESLFKTLYVPAGRTGLVLTLPAVLSRLLGSLASIEGNAGSLSLPVPVVHFLQRLTEGASPHRLEPEGGISDYIEKNILFGRISRDRTETPIFSFSPAGSGKSLPLHGASSLVTELGPVAEIIRGADFGSIILEEPEAHLHLEAQKNMARACARMVNAGINVIITTHSDTFLQQLNNLINVQRHPRRDDLMQKWGLDLEDLIDPAAARGYEFVEGEGGSRVQPMRLGRGGFVAETMNRTLRDMALLTRDVLADDEEEGA